MSGKTRSGTYSRLWHFKRSGCGLVIEKELQLSQDKPMGLIKDLTQPSSRKAQPFGTRSTYNTIIEDPGARSRCMSAKTAISHLVSLCLTPSQPSNCFKRIIILCQLLKM